MEEEEEEYTTDISSSIAVKYDVSGEDEGKELELELEGEFDERKELELEEEFDEEKEVEEMMSLMEMEELEETRPKKKRQTSSEINERKKKISDEIDYLKGKIGKKKVRHVDMGKFFPEESSTSIDGKKKKGDDDDEESVSGERSIDHTDEYKTFKQGNWANRDPSFLKKKVITVDVIEEFSEEEDVEEVFVEVEEEEEFPQEICVHTEKEMSDQVYDQLCEMDSPVSSDISFILPPFKYVHRRNVPPKRGEEYENDRWLKDVEVSDANAVPFNVINYLQENISDALKRSLGEVGLYRPQNAIHYLTHYMLQKTKTPEEIGLEPDPHLIQSLVDSYTKKKKSFRKEREYTLERYGEEASSEFADYQYVPSQSSKSSVHSQIHQIKMKYLEAKMKMDEDEKDRLEKMLKYLGIDPRTCLGPTTLPLPMQPAPQPAATPAINKSPSKG